MVPWPWLAGGRVSPGEPKQIWWGVEGGAKQTKGVEADQGQGLIGQKRFGPKRAPETDPKLLQSRRLGLTGVRFWRPREPLGLTGVRPFGTI